MEKADHLSINLMMKENKLNENTNYYKHNQKVPENIHLWQASST